MRLFFLMLFSAADYTHALTHDKSWTEKSKHPTNFFHHLKPFLCYDTVAAAVHSLSLRSAGWMWLADIQALFSSAVELSRSEWPPLWCRLCGPGQDTGLQDCENCFTPRLPPFYFFLVCRSVLCARRHYRSILGAIFAAWNASVSCCCVFSWWLMMLFCFY